MEDYFVVYKKEIDKQVKIAQEKIKGDAREREYIPLERYPFFALQEKICKALAEKFPESATVVRLELASPPPHIVSDFALNLIPIARENKENPDTVAATARAVIKEAGVNGVKDTTPTGGYLNISLEHPKFYEETIAAVRKLKERYGESNGNAGEIALIEYSSPNIAKPIGVGHLRSTIIGEALARIYSATGYAVIRENYLGDWGTPFGKLVHGISIESVPPNTLSNGITPTLTSPDLQDLSVQDLKGFYIRGNEEAEKSKQAEDETRAIFAKLENGDPKTVELWKKFREISIKNFGETYKRFGIKFDLQIGESYFADAAKHMVESAIEKGVAHKDTESDAIIVVDEEPGIPSFLLRKSDGSTLYVARELAAIEFRATKFHPQEILDVVGHEQEVHFKQAYALARKMGILPKDTEAKHISFGMVLVDGKKMSTRKGTLVELDELLSQSVEKSRAIMKEKNPVLEPKELDEISEIVGLGAVIYNDLRQSRMRNISFDWDRMLDFESGSAAYLQYTCVRIQSIVRKVAELGLATPQTEHAVYEKESEFALVKKLSLFPKIIIEAQKDAAPHVIATYLEELAQLLNTFYGEVSIIRTEDDHLRASRIALIESVATVLQNGLSLLNIRVPEKM